MCVVFFFVFFFCVCERERGEHACVRVCRRACVACVICFLFTGILLKTTGIHPKLYLSLTSRFPCGIDIVIYGSFTEKGLSVRLRPPVLQAGIGKTSF